MIDDPETCACPFCEAECEAVPEPHRGRPVYHCETCRFFFQLDDDEED